MALIYSARRVGSNLVFASGGAGSVAPPPTTLTQADLDAIDALIVARLGDISAAVRTEIAAELERINKIAALHAIDATLVVTPTARTAGSVSQTISTVGSTTTVS